jgi:radical SAM superfamily enzyme YgiQ (UPF0313 family)
LPRVLLTTVYRERPFDFLDLGSGEPLRFSAPTLISCALRFLKQNVPEVEILEYPTREEYLRRLEEGWDVVGFSFYGHEIPEILEMADLARRKGVGELWAGNYGALTPGMEEYFDRIFRGYAEEEVASFFGRRIREVVHPPLVYGFTSPFRLWLNRFGILFTSRGCPFRCSFCQIRLFCPKPHTLPLGSIERVLRYYAERGVRQVWIFDDTFGTFRRHADEVISLLERYRLYWVPMTTVSLLLENWEDWSRRGLVGAVVGVESLDPGNLEFLRKGHRPGEVYELARRVRESRPPPHFRFHGYHLLAFYILGFEGDTVEGIKEGLRRLRELPFLFTQLFVLTPIPGTELWEYIGERYGIFESDLHRYDGKHLVWNHPHLSPGEMEALLAWGMRYLNSWALPRYALRGLPDYLLNFGWYFRNFALTNTYDYRRGRFFGVG